MNCIICFSLSNFYQRDKKRNYYQCSCCELIFVPREEIISRADEKARYDLHNNEESNLNYKNYLENILVEVLKILGPNERGLDFGCGKSTLIADLFSQRNMLVDSYDLYFHQNEFIWKSKYDFILMSEVIEHLREPLDTLKKLKQILKPEGKLIIKTKFFTSNPENFNNWFYKNDQTHIQFFNEKSLNKLGESVDLGFFCSMDLSDLYYLKSQVAKV